MAKDAEPIQSNADHPPAAAAFANIPDHQLIRLIGRGSYGDVWLAKNTLGTCRAIKIVYENTFRHKRPFEREFNGVQKFEPLSRSHDGLMDILQVGRNDRAGYFYCVMELADDAVSGRAIDPDNYSPRTLAHDMAKHKRLPLAECRRIGTSIATALSFLHDRGLIHRDIKPSNIVFVDGIPKLADIGLVAEMSEAKSYVGTEGFIPPEGPGTVQGDIYSLGKVLYEISTGKDRHDYPELPTYLGEPAQKRELIELNKIILTACRADPLQRYRSAANMAADLAEFRCREHSWRQTTRRWTRRIALAAVAAAAGVWLAWSMLKPATIPAPPGLVAWWRAEGTPTDSIGGADAKAIGPLTYGPGKVGQGFVFDGRGGGLRIEDQRGLQLQDFTIETWVRRHDPALATHDQYRWGHIFGYGTGGYGIGLRNDGAIAISRIGGGVGSGAVTTPPLITDTRFHHVAATKSGSVVLLYIDGAVRAAENLKTVFTFETSPWIGGRTDDPYGGTFLGTIDEVSIYNQPLRGDEIQGLYRSGRAGKTPPPPSVTISPGPVGWWRAEGDGKDSAGAHDASLYGVTFVRGRVGRAFDFEFPPERSRYRMRVPDDDAFKLAHSLTIEGWVFIRSDGGVIFHRGDDRPGLDPYSLESGGPRRIQFQIQSLTDSAKLSAPIAYSEWKHVAATLEDDSGAMKLYVDGELVATTNTPVRPLADLDPRFNPAIAIGNVGDLARTVPLDGMVDEIALYARALSAREIRTIYEAGSSGKRPLDAPQRRTATANRNSPKSASVPAPAGLIGWWPGEGNARDLLGQSDGVLANKVSFAPGMVGQAFRFNEAGDTVKIFPKTRTLDPGAELTIEFWMKADLNNPMLGCCQGLVTSDFYSIDVSPGYNFWSGINFNISTNTSPRDEDAPETAGVNNGGALISSDEWHHIAGTYDGTRLQLYIDGKPAGKPRFQTGTIAAMLPGSFVALGSSDGRTVAPSIIGQRYFKGGLLDEVSMYNRALLPEEVAAICHAGSSGKTFTPPTP